MEGTAQTDNTNHILRGKITDIPVTVIDTTLSRAGQAAEAKATGEAIAGVAKAAKQAADTAEYAKKEVEKVTSAISAEHIPITDETATALGLTSDDPTVDEALGRMSDAAFIKNDSWTARLGIDWTEIDSDLICDYTINDIVYGNGVYVLSHSGKSSIYYSYDLKHWEEVTTPCDVNRVIFANGVFIGHYGSAAVNYEYVYSYDAITWTSVTVNLSNLNPNAGSNHSIGPMCYAGGYFILISAKQDYSHYYAYSTDGVNWNVSSQIINTYTHIVNSRIVYSNGVFACSSTENAVTYIRTTTDLEAGTWRTAYSFGSDFSTVGTLRVVNNIFFIFSSNGDRYSEDGVTWSTFTHPANFPLSYTTLCNYIDNKYVVVRSGMAHITDDVFSDWSVTQVNPSERITCLSLTPEGILIGRDNNDVLYINPVGEKYTGSTYLANATGSKVADAVKIETGAYYGAGGGNTITLTFSFQPKLIIIGESTGGTYAGPVIIKWGCTRFFTISGGNYPVAIGCSFGTRSVSFSATSNTVSCYSLDQAGYVYKYTAIG